MRTVRTLSADLVAGHQSDDDEQLIDDVVSGASEYSAFCREAFKQASIAWRGCRPHGSVCGRGPRSESHLRLGRGVELRWPAWCSRIHSSIVVTRCAVSASSSADHR